MSNLKKFLILLVAIVVLVGLDSLQKVITKATIWKWR